MESIVQMKNEIELTQKINFELKTDVEPITLPELSNHSTMLPRPRHQPVKAVRRENLERKGRWVGNKP